MQVSTLFCCSFSSFCICQPLIPCGNRPVERSDRELWCFTCSQSVSHTAKLSSYADIDIFTNISQHIRKPRIHMQGYEYLWPLFQWISEYLVVAFFLFFNFCTTWISDFERLWWGGAWFSVGDLWRSFNTLLQKSCNRETFEKCVLLLYNTPSFNKIHIKRNKNTWFKRTTHTESPKQKIN